MFVQTKSSKLRNNNGETCQEVVFGSKKRKKSTSIEEDTDEDVEKQIKNEKLDLKKLRYDIIKFGSSGFDRTKKEESRIALAVALGAKPPKNKARNYTEILKEKKMMKEKKLGSETKKGAKSSNKKQGFKQKKYRNESRGLLNKYGVVDNVKKF